MIPRWLRFLACRWLEGIGRGIFWITVGFREGHLRSGIYHFRDISLGKVAALCPGPVDWPGPGDGSTNFTALSPCVTLHAPESMSFDFVGDDESEPHLRIGSHLTHKRSETVGVCSVNMTGLPMLFLPQNVINGGFRVRVSKERVEDLVKVHGPAKPDGADQKSSLRAV